MGIEALTHSRDGENRTPHGDAWREWVAATTTRNFMIQDPLLDWLDLHGEEAGFRRDAELPNYDPRTDFTEFLFKKATEFEQAVAAHLRTLLRLVSIAGGPEDLRNQAKAEETFEAMREGEPAIWQGVLWDADSRTYGAPDVLIRSDELLRLFPESIAESTASLVAPDLGDVSWHYRVVDIKFTTLRLLASGVLGNTGSAPAYRAQVHIYNQALGRLQGYLPPESYLLGRGWEQRRAGQVERGTNCMDRLAPIPQNTDPTADGSLDPETEAAIDWVRRVVRKGSSWVVLPEPDHPELRPNLGNKEDSPWHAEKSRIARELEDLTILWGVGLRGREQANAEGIFRWTDPRCTPESVNVRGEKRASTLQAMLDANRDPVSPFVVPPRITAAQDKWRQERHEFFVDFETVNDLDDDFSAIPEKQGQPTIFMIGCGHLEAGEWSFKCFVADSLSLDAEAKVIDEWMGYMASATDRLQPSGPEPLVYHWSKAESVSLSTAYNAAVVRHPNRNWPTPNWFDFLQEVVRAQPVVARGAFSFGLKSFAKALHAAGCIGTLWADGPTDGLGAMAGAWWSGAEAARRGISLRDVDLIEEIRKYNEVDCKVMMEALAYFRRCH